MKRDRTCCEAHGAATGALRAFAQARSGAMTVELGLIAPLLILLLVGVYEVSRIIDTQQVLQSAARIGASYAVIRPPVQGDVTGIRNAITRTLPGEMTSGQGVDAAQITSSLSCECSGGAPIACTGSCAAGQARQTYISVNVSWRHKLLFGLPALPSRLRMSATSIMRLQ